MIPVKEQPEPADFDEDVRKKGQKWLQDKKIPANQAVPKGTTLSPYWRKCLDDLYDAYDQTCAYLCVFLERAVGAVTTEHFVAKSQEAGLAYEWSNFRLACSMINSRKGVFQDVLDPFEIQPNMFRLELITGRIYASPELSPGDCDAVNDTIGRLKLDGAMNRAMRTRHYGDYIDREITESYLKRMSPFVWHEASRQDLLRES